MVVVFVGCFLDEAARHRPFIDPELYHHQEMQAHKSNEHPRYHEHVQGKKPGQGRTSDDWSTKHQFHDGRPQKRDTAGNGCSEAESPVRVLIETKDLSGECHPQRHEKEEYSANPGELAGKLKSAQQTDFHHITKYHYDQELRAH